MAFPKRTKTWLDSRSADSAPPAGNFCERIGLGPGATAIVVGDVTGEGAHPSEPARKLKAFIVAMLFEGVSPGTLLLFANRYFTLCLMEESIASASLFVAVANPEACTVRYASAGHETALLFGGTGSHMHLPPTGPLLGIGPQRERTSLPFERTVRLSAHDTLLVVTDGITSACPSSGDAVVFGSSGIVRAVAAARFEGADLARAVHDAAAAHAERPLPGDARVVMSDFSRTVVRDARSTRKEHGQSLSAASQP